MQWGPYVFSYVQNACKLANNTQSKKRPNGYYKVICEPKICPNLCKSCSLLQIRLPEDLQLQIVFM
jgi:hypothetical protein